MNQQTINAQKANQLVQSGALLIDIRDADEFAREHIQHAQHIPMNLISSQTIRPAEQQAVIFYCRSGNRTQVNSAVLHASANADTYILEGGLDAWKKAGLPIEHDATQPLELNRQVQIAAGSIIVLGAILGASVSPWWHLLSAFVGAGLVFAGISGFCGLARVLMKMPWNKRSIAA